MYSVWSNESATRVLEELKILFDGIGFSIINSTSGMCHLWSEEGDCSLVSEQFITEVSSEKMPMGIQWWRGDDDIFVTIFTDQSVGGATCDIRLVGFSREAQAEIGRLLILKIIPDKQLFPDDFAVFKVIAQ